MTPLPTVDLSVPQRIHIVGIGGTGMSAIARVLHDMGHSISGSDAQESPTLESLRSLGINVTAGHNPANISDSVDLVAISTAVGSTNADVQAAREKMKPVVSRATILSAIARTKRVVAVAGTHGKTTTSSLVAAALSGGGLQPSWIIGGDIGGKGGANWGSGEWLVLEADESDGTFLTLGAECGVVTNIEPDHLEHYGGWPQLQQAFVDFVEAIGGPVFVCVDDVGVRDMVDTLGKLDRIHTYGTSQGADWQIQDVKPSDFGVSFTVVNEGEATALVVPVPGMHNARNATAAFGLAVSLQADREGAARAIADFVGVGRRFQQRGNKAGVVFVDDYAHLPTEVEAAISAAKDGSWNRVVAVFQPHRYSRTEQVGKDFADSFRDADVVVLTDVYAAGESPRPGIDGDLVRNAVEATGKQVFYVQDRQQLASAVRELLFEGDICLSLGAGDITKLADEVQDGL